MLEEVKINSKRYGKGSGIVVAKDIYDRYYVDFTILSDDQEIILDSGMDFFDDNELIKIPIQINYKDSFYIARQFIEDMNLYDEYEEYKEYKEIL